MKFKQCISMLILGAIAVGHGAIVLGAQELIRGLEKQIGLKKKRQPRKIRVKPDVKFDEKEYKNLLLQLVDIKENPDFIENLEDFQAALEVFKKLKNFVNHIENLPESPQKQEWLKYNELILIPARQEASSAIKKRYKQLLIDLGADFTKLMENLNPAIVKNDPQILEKNSKLGFDFIQKKVLPHDNILTSELQSKNLSSVFSKELNNQLKELIKDLKNETERLNTTSIAIIAANPRVYSAYLLEMEALFKKYKTSKELFKNFPNFQNMLDNFGKAIKKVREMERPYKIL